jgi:hypothetical protein
MYPYLRNESEMDDFNNTFDIASKLFLRRKSSRQKAADQLVELGKKVVRPLVYTLECGIQSDMSDEELDVLAEEVENILIRIGENALPDLEDFATNGSCNIYVNGFAQEAIFKVMGLAENDKRRFCKHMGKVLIERGKKKVWQCVFCGDEFEYKKES